MENHLKAIGGGRISHSRHHLNTSGRYVGIEGQGRDEVTQNGTEWSIIGAKETSRQQQPIRSPDPSRKHGVRETGNTEYNIALKGPHGLLPGSSVSLHPQVSFKPQWDVTSAFHIFTNSKNQYVCYPQLHIVSKIQVNDVYTNLGYDAYRRSVALGQKNTKMK